MVYKNTISLVLLFAVLFSPLITFISANLYSVDVDFVKPLMFTITAFTVIIVFLFLGNYFTRGRFNILNVTIYLSFIYICLFYFEEFVWLIVNYAPYIAGYYKFLLIALIILFASFVLLKVEFLKKFFVGFFIIILVLSIFSLLLSGIDPSRSKDFDPLENVSKEGISSHIYSNRTLDTPKNIYYIVSDELGSRKGLKVGGVNPNILNKIEGLLEENDFYIAKNASSSYNITHFILQSILEMDYPLVKNSRYNPFDFFPASVNSLDRKNTPLQTTLKSLGYGKLLWFGNSAMDCSDRSTLDCPSVKSTGLSLFEKVYLDDSLMTYLSTSIYPRILYKVLNWLDVKQQKNDAIGKAISYINSTSYSSESTPSFFLIHQLIPHVPHVSEDCKRLAVSRQDDKKGYISSVSCLGKRLDRLIELISQKDNDSIIVVTADHGTSFLQPYMKYANFKDILPKKIIERHSIFSSIKVPNSCRQYLYPNIGTVNSIRIAVSCAIGASPKLIKDKNYFILFEKDNTIHNIGKKEQPDSLSVTDVTNRLTESPE